MNCEKCGAPIADDVKFCPNCGAPVPEPETAPAVVPEPETAPAAASEPETAPAAAPEPETAPAAAPEPETAPVAASEAQPEPTPPKKRGGRKWPWIVAGVVVVLAALVLIFLNPIKDLINRNIISPADQYRRAEAITAMRMGDTMADAAPVLARPLAQIGDRRMDADFSITLGDSALDLLQLSTNQDFSWLKQIGLRLSETESGDKTGAGLELLLSGASLLKLDVIEDLPAKKLYVSVPTLVEGYFTVDMPEGGMSLLRENLGPAGELLTLPAASVTDEDARVRAQALEAAVPKPEELKDFTNRYAALILSEIDDVERSGRQRLTAGDVSAEYDTLTVHLTGAMLNRIVERVLTEMEQDAALKTMITRFTVPMEYSDEESCWTDFLMQMNLLGALAEGLLEQVDTKLDMTVWLDGDIIIGRTITWEGKEVVTAAAPEQNGKQGFLLRVVIGDVPLSLSGSGTAGRKLNGSYTFSRGEQDYVTFVLEDVDAEALKNGVFKGGFVIEPDRTVLDTVLSPLRDSMPAAASRLLERLRLRLTLDTEPDRASGSLSILAGEDALLTIETNSSTGAAETIRVPEKTLETLEDWLAGIGPTQIQNILAILAEAGVPSEIIQTLAFAALLRG